MSRDSAPYFSRSTTARISIAVSTRRSRREMLAGLGSRGGRNVVVLPFRRSQVQPAGRSCRAAQEKINRMMWGWKPTPLRRKPCPTSMIR
jgi:hypothetical protein